MGATEDPGALDEPPARVTRNPKMLGIVFGVLGLASLIAIVGTIVFLVRKSSATEKKEEIETEAKPIASATASVSAAPSESTEPAPSAAPSLQKGFGWLTLTGPSGTVMVKGKGWGDSGTKIAVPCGHQWISISVLNDKGKIEKTLTKPQSIFVKCGGETEATAKTKK